MISTAFARSQAAGKYAGAPLRFAQTQRLTKRQYICSQWRICGQYARCRIGREQAGPPPSCSGAEAGEQERQANSRNCLRPREQKHVLLVSFILLSVHQVPSSATSVSVLVLWWFEAGSEVQDGVGGSK